MTAALPVGSIAAGRACAGCYAEEVLAPDSVDPPAAPAVDRTISHLAEDLAPRQAT